MVFWTSLGHFDFVWLLRTKATLKIKLFIDLEIWSQINLIIWLSVLQSILNMRNIEHSIKEKRKRPNPFFYALLLLITKNYLLFLKAGIFFRRYHGARHISKLLCVIHKLFYVLRKKFTENSLEMCQITQCFLLKVFFKQNNPLILIDTLENVVNTEKNTLTKTELLYLKNAGA